MLVSFRAMVIVTLRISSCQPPRLRTVVLTRDAFLTPTPSDTLEANGITVDRDTACKHHRLFTLDRSDSAMTSLDNRLYGHSMKALTWQLQNISECVWENDIISLLLRLSTLVMSDRYGLNRVFPTVLSIQLGIIEAS
ncbi:hypothetical protein MAP00_001270 [Monascus purpureus]|nr:hypothetical protein MAP00_001270 [Monascus purpureus]